SAHAHPVPLLPLYRLPAAPGGRHGAGAAGPLLGGAGNLRPRLAPLHPPERLPVPHAASPAYRPQAERAVAPGEHAGDAAGGVRGIVSDSTGATAAGVRVFIVGTAFAVTAGPDGRYAIDFVPGGRYTVRAELGEYAATEQPAVLVLGGGTLRLDLRLGAAAPSRRPLFAAPQGFASGLRIDGDALRDLPIDDPRQALMLAPGVVLHGGGLGIDSPPDLSIHGGPPGE